MEAEEEEEELRAAAAACGEYMRAFFMISETIQCLCLLKGLEGSNFTYILYNHSSFILRAA